MHNRNRMKLKDLMLASGEKFCVDELFAEVADLRSLGKGLSYQVSHGQEFQGTMESEVRSIVRLRGSVRIPLCSGSSGRIGAGGIIDVT